MFGRKLKSPFASGSGSGLQPTRRDYKLAARIVEQSDQLRKLTDSELRQRFQALRPESDGLGVVNLEPIVEPAFACIREAARRTLSMAHYEVQLLAGIALARGQVAEMATGEGKTLVATLPAAIHGLAGNGSHVMTVNDYLADRDYRLMRPVFHCLGLTTGLLVPKASPEEKRIAYACDVTYGTGPEFGFDYLRDQLGLLNTPKRRLGETFTAALRGVDLHQNQPVQRAPGFALVDEADSVMIDEANSALILSGSSGQPSPWPEIYRRAHEVASSLVEGSDFDIDTRAGSITLADRGVHTIFASPEELRKIRLVRPWRSYVEQALRAIHLIQRDVEYIVIDDSIQIVDEFTGRRFEDRSWSEGLHQAVEAKEDVVITEESNALLRISRQRYLGFYPCLAGMTGTATGCEREFSEIFNLSICQIPRRKKSRRVDHEIEFFGSADIKHAAIVSRAVSLAESGRPVLIGTTTVKASEKLERLLIAAGARPRVLNARHDAAEAELIATAGNSGLITIATNMAGRGSDIPLGPGVEALGGLVVLAAELNESSRIDRQLTGRAGRQGDPGESWTFAGPDDALFAQHSPELCEKIRQTAIDVSGCSAAGLSREVARLQKKIEVQRFDARKSLVRRDRWLHDLLDKAV